MMDHVAQRQTEGIYAITIANGEAKYTVQNPQGLTTGF
jgi:hypothetical protein